MNAENLRRGLRTALLTLPIAITIRDNLYSICRVRGESMEPSLQDGDIVLVRKLDLFLNGKKICWTKPPSPEDNIADKEMVEEESIVAEHLEKMDHIDFMYGRCSSLAFETPNPVPGSVIVVCSPTDFPIKYCIKRVIALEGQRCRPANNPRCMKYVPENSVWVEGDNREDSEDSCSYGPINKKLIVGQAERILWPPSRFGPMRRVEPPFGRARW